MKAQLSHADVQRLLDSPSVDVRADLAAKVAEVYRGKLDPREREMAEDIFRAMVRDADTRVRQALSEALKSNPRVPHEVALTLARDIEAVAVPMLQATSVLSDDDLIEIVCGRATPQQIAVASRAAVSPRVAGALVDHGDETAVETLMRNPGAELDERGYGRAIERFGHRRPVMDAMAERSMVPPRIVERLVHLISEHLKLNLALSNHLPAELAEALVLQAHDRTTLELWPEDFDPQEVDALVADLHRRGRLSDTLILRAFCEADFGFAVAALARRAGLQPEEGWAMLHH
ncbi:MAG TPA: DUF2336 domain-containing protein, partial [Alphaproteobacteria bacterium]|nr:DUF2336 domain-containing protein [Alphaproteobacteria bacterium]